MLLRIISIWGLLLFSVFSSAQELPSSFEGSAEQLAVYVIPITGAISKPNLYILRRGLKDAIENKADMLLLNMDTPGGRVDLKIEMIQMLAMFDGI